MAPRAAAGLSRSAEPGVAPRSSRRSEPGSRPDHHRITSRYHAQTVVDLFRNAKFDPHSNPLAAPNLGSPAPTSPRSHCEETENKKSARIATFLRLAIVMGSSDRGSRCKSAGKRLFSSVFPLWGNRKEPLIAKKLHKWRDFLFLRGADRCNATDPAKGKSPQWGGHAKNELTRVGSSKLPFSSRGLWFSES